MMVFKSSLGPLATFLKACQKLFNRKINKNKKKRFLIIFKGMIVFLKALARRSLNF